MIKSVFRAIFIAAALCFGFLSHAGAQPKPTIAPPSSPPMRVNPSIEVERPSRTATEGPAAAALPAQKPRATTHARICGNPRVPCKTSIKFEPFALPFRVPENGVIIDTETFYAVILKSIKGDQSDCNIFIPETERLAAQALFPDHKVFTSRCNDIETEFFSNTNPNSRFMAVFAGTTLAEANRMLAAVKATKNFSAAKLRRMRTGFNGT